MLDRSTFALTLAAAALLFVAALYTATTVGSEFMPPLDEETALFMPITDPRISLTKATQIMRQQDKIIAADPAVEKVVGKIGRAETATDPAPINMAETMLILKPKDQWPKGVTKDAILQRLDEKLRIVRAEEPEEPAVLDAEARQGDRRAHPRPPAALRRPVGDLDLEPPVAGLIIEAETRGVGDAGRPGRP